MEARTREAKGIREGDDLRAVIRGAARRIKKRHLTANFSQHGRRSSPPRSPIIRTVKFPERARVLTEVLAQVRVNRRLVRHQIIGRKAERTIVPGLRGGRSRNLRGQLFVDASEPLALIGQVRLSSKLVSHLVANQIGMDDK